MDSGDRIPPTPKLFDYPGVTSIGLGILFTSILLFMINKFDPTGGMLAISLMVVLAFMSVVVFCLYFSPPSDEITSGAIGGLIAAFGAVIAFWLGRGKGPL